MPSKEIMVEGLGLVELVKRKNSRNIRLNVSPDGHVRVSLPTWAPYQAGLTFARSKADWIASQRTHVKQVILRNRQAVGKAHHLYFEPSASSRSVSSRVKGSQIIVMYPSDLRETNASVQKAARLASIRALRSDAEALIPKRLNVLALQGGFKYKSIQVKQLKRRWGSCNSHKEIVINLFLVQFSWQIIDYVLWHELTHTKYLHHGEDFWDELQRHVPNAKALRRQMRELNTDVVSG
ncbi:MAG TPA: YgjP-like metallopeptidase domain-containing protein [Candidatus Binatia bacterium]|nr:YgjP-like metallopeptidase domain-containing protein [Candidatus Binatia bacterium]